MNYRNAEREAAAGGKERDTEGTDIHTRNHPHMCDGLQPLDPTVSVTELFTVVQLGGCINCSEPNLFRRRDYISIFNS